MDYFTWNPQVHLRFLGGNADIEEIARRTLSITYVDRLRSFDHIEWELDNRDGYLTRPEFVMTGLVAQLKMGYIDGSFEWKSFIINALNGGVGVWGEPSSPVGDNEGKIRFMGRNRNAPGGSLSRSWSHRSRNPGSRFPGASTGGKRKKNQKLYGPTADVTSHDMIATDSPSPRFVPGSTTSEVIRRIVKRYGFTEGRAVVQDTFDYLDGGGLSIPVGYTDAEYLAVLADEDQRGFTCKVTDGIFYWHSPYWAGAPAQLAASYTYGHGDGINKLSLLADFKLPMPSSMRAAGLDVRRRSLYLKDQDIDAAKRTSNIGITYRDIVKDHARFNAISRVETFPVIATSSRAVDDRLSERFIARHRATMGLMVDVVGNPDILAGKLVEIKGTGSPFVDHIWSVTEVKHQHDGKKYETFMKLMLPPKSSTSGKLIRTTLYERDTPSGPGDGGGVNNVGVTYREKRSPKYRPSTPIRQSRR